MALTLWFADAILFKGVEFTIDANVVQNIHDEFKFSDVHLQDVLHLEEGPRLDFTVDANAILRPTFDYTLDALLEEQDKLETFSIDANAQIMPSQNYEIDAYLQKGFSTTFDLDAVLIVRNDDDSILDARLVRRPSETFTIDPITIGTLETEPIIDGLISFENIPTSFLVDGIPQFVPEARSRVDAYLQETFELATLVDARVILQPDLNFTIDASIQKDGFKPFNVDAFLLDTFGSLPTVDAQVVLSSGNIDVCTVHLCTPTQPVEFFTADAIVIESTPFEWTIDAHIEKPGFSTSFTLDANLAKRFIDEFTLDASLVILSQFNACPSITRQSLNCVSVIRRRGT